MASAIVTVEDSDDSGSVAQDPPIVTSEKRTAEPADTFEYPTVPKPQGGVEVSDQSDSDDSDILGTLLGTNSSRRRKRKKTPSASRKAKRSTINLASDSDDTGPNLSDEEDVQILRNVRPQFRPKLNVPQYDTDVQISAQAVRRVMSSDPTLVALRNDIRQTQVSQLELQRHLSEEIRAPSPEPEPQAASSSAAAADKGKKISLCAKAGPKYGGKTVKFKLYENQNILDVLSAVAKKLNVDVSRVKLSVDGEDVELSSTPQDFDLEDGDQIDISVK